MSILASGLQDTFSGKNAKGVAAVGAGAATLTAASGFSIFGLTGLNAILATMGIAVAAIILLVILAKLFKKFILPKIKKARANRKQHASVRKALLEASTNIKLKKGTLKNYHVGWVNGALIGKDPDKKYFCLVGQKSKDGKIKIISAQDKNKHFWVDENVLKDKNLVQDLYKQAEEVAKKYDSGKKAWDAESTSQERTAGENYLKKYDKNGNFIGSNSNEIEDSILNTGINSNGTKSAAPGPVQEFAIDPSIAEFLNKGQITKLTKLALKDSTTYQEFLKYANKNLDKIDSKVAQKISDTPDNKKHDKIKDWGKGKKKSGIQKIVKKYIPEKKKPKKSKPAPSHKPLQKGPR